MVLDIEITYIYCIMAWNVLYRKIICDRERDYERWKRKLQRICCKVVSLRVFFANIMEGLENFSVDVAHIG